MTDLDWQQIKSLFAEALLLPSDQHTAFLGNRCNGDDRLFDEIKSLLAASDQPDNLIENNAIDLAAKIGGSTNDQTEQHFGNYRIVREIGSGGMGTVFLATRDDGEFTKQVALKIVRQSIADRDIIERFKRERQILANLNHPNIAALHDGGINEKGEPYLAMEYVDGETLVEFCDQKRLTIPERLRLFIKICSAVAYAHRNLVVHRDIKPSNILITRDGEPKLLDFGLARAFESDGSKTQTALRAFTPAYASPEQIQGGSITTASDVYSLGVVFYELLTGTKPLNVEDKSFDEIVQTINKTEPVKPSDAVTKKEEEKGRKGEGESIVAPPSISPSPRLAVSSSQLRGDLDNIALTAIRKEPERRFASVEDFAKDIERHLAGRPISAHPNTVVYLAGKFVRRNKIVVAAVSFILISIVIGAAFAFWQANAARRQRDIAKNESEKAERINKFLQQMLSFSNQSFTSVSPVANGKNVTVNEMLDQITPTIEAELADQPEVRSKILRTIGSSYASQGFYEKAERNLRSALDTQLQIYGENNTETADTMIELGVLNYRQSKFQDSHQLLEKAANFYRRYQADFPNNSPAKFIQSLDFLAANKFYAGDIKTSVSLYEEGLKIALNADLKGNEREVLAGLQADFGLIVTRLGDNQRGEALIRQAIALYSEISNKPRWEVGNAKAALSLNLINRNDLDSAQRELAESEAIIRETLGDKNLYLASTLKGQSNLFIQKSDFNSAEKAARESLKIFQEIFPSNNPFSAGTLVALGTTLTKAGREQEGEANLRQALEIYEHQPMKNFTLIVPNIIALTDNLVIQNRLVEAEKLAMETLSEAQQNLGEDNSVTQSAISNLAKVYEKQGKTDLTQKYRAK